MPFAMFQILLSAFFKIIGATIKTNPVSPIKKLKNIDKDLIDPGICIMAIIPRMMKNPPLKACNHDLS
jgi:hypothetical protein